MVAVKREDLVMGYSYDARTGKLCCDSCGNIGGVRKRTCPHKVDGMPYCSPSALCSACYAKYRDTLHDGCAEAAARSQARADEENAALACGSHLWRTSWGDWHDAVPAGLVGVRFVSETEEVFALISEATYDRLGDYRRLGLVPTLERLHADGCPVQQIPAFA